MKEVPKQDAPDVAGGNFHEGGCIPVPGLPSPDDPFPRNPFGPIYSDGPTDGGCV